MIDKTILHIDFDSFFASCEQHFNPNLRGKPIGVTAANGRTCIVAASKEAKKFGIKTGTRTWEADTLCPAIQYVQGDFDRYLDITKKFIEIASSYSPYVEAFSLDEVFIDMTATLHLYAKDVVSFSELFKKRIASEISPVTTVSIGVSYNKLLAKLASGLNKPDGLMLIDRTNIDSVYKNTNLTDICGIGDRLKYRLNILGVYNLLSLRTYPLRLLKKEFGTVCAEQLLCYAWGQDNSEVTSLFEEVDAKSVGRNYCLPANEENQEKVLQILSELSEEVAKRLRAMNKKARTVSLYLSGEKSLGGRKTIFTYINSGKEIFEVLKLFYKEWGWHYMVRQVHISVTNLIDEKYVTPSLFADPREEILNHTIDNLNKQFGSHTIRHGYVLYAPKLSTKPNGFFGDKAFYLPYLRSSA
ncbi:MAG TPA: DNA polymerase IV [Candidatus Levybacteria bacterium]|nr:DNA polymerase IV [Candidatus Levybacteria bacterium]